MDSEKFGSSSGVGAWVCGNSSGVFCGSCMGSGVWLHGGCNLSTVMGRSVNGGWFVVHGDELAAKGWG